ncbi:MAG: tetraacyldisaccharide 4'-kinase [Aureispira sp.]
MPLLSSPNKSLWQFLGQPVGWLYGVGAWLHRAAYVYGPLERASFAPFVICIGNLSVGGTGKSPHVLYLQRLLGEVEQTAMISRGYGRQTKGVQWVAINSVPEVVGDEPLQFKQAYPLATVVVAERRALGIQAALKKKPTLQQVLLDDALQHWGVAANCTFLLTTFDAPFFQQTLLPFGRLREFRKGYQRADIIIVSKCPSELDDATKNTYKTAIAPLPHQRVLFSWIVYQPLYELKTKAPGPSLDQPLDIVLLTGIANTQALEKYLSSHRVTCQRFPDHHLFTPEELQQLEIIAAEKIIITTQKDATRLYPLLEQFPEIQLTIYVLPIQVALPKTEEAWLVHYLQEKKKEASRTQKNSY